MHNASMKQLNLEGFLARSVVAWSGGGGAF